MFSNIVINMLPIVRSNIYQSSWKGHLPKLLSISQSAAITSKDVLRGCTAGFHTSVPLSAARKGTRARKEAIKKANKKKKIEQEVNKEFIPFDVRVKMQKFGKVTPRQDVSWKAILPEEDDVIGTAFFQPELFSAAEAVEFHKETHHPTMYNLPQAPLFLKVELSLSTDKKNRYVDHISTVIDLPHQFPTGQERMVAVLTDCPETRTAVQEQGAHLVGGKEMVALVLSGEVDLSPYDYIISSLEILPDLVPIRGLLKKSFPNPKTGTAAQNVRQAVDCFLHGLQYEIIRDKYDLDYGHIHSPIGTVDMPTEHIAANIEAFLRDIESHRSGRKTNDLITTARLECTPINEHFYLNHNDIIGRVRSKSTTASGSSESETASAAAN